MMRLHTTVYLFLLLWLLFTITTFIHFNKWPQASHTITPPPPPERSTRHKSNTNSHLKYHKKDTKLLTTDLIYSRDWWEKPTVIEEYKLIFFTIPKNGCTEWKLLFRKMMGMSIPKNVRSHDVIMAIHNPQTNNMTTLDNYSIHIAEEMMKSLEWTRAVFLRDPKERILSAFLDKFVSKDYFIRQCCSSTKTSECQVKRSQKDFWYFLNSDCKDPHWEPQITMIDEKWWPYIDFIGSFTTIREDSERLLKLLKSTKDGKSAWEKVGKSGWGRNGTSGFLQENSAGHSGGARDLFAEYYNKDYEALVEEKWKVEWASPFSPF
jgi:hypothetical protein